MKQEHEFFAADAMAWREAQQPGTEEKVLSQDGDDPAVLTRLVRWAPGLDTSDAGVITHDYVEEVYLLEGELIDLTLGWTFRAGHYASRRPGMRHGPYRTPVGCTMLEVRYRVPAVLPEVQRYPRISQGAAVDELAGRVQVARVGGGLGDHRRRRRFRGNAPPLGACRSSTCSPATQARNQKRSTSRARCWGTSLRDRNSLRD